MARKNYTDLFRRQAVDLYRGTPGATLRGIAADLGISRHTLQALGARAGPGPGTAVARRGLRPQPASKQGRQAKRPARASPEVELAALRARVAALETENDAKIATERDILRQAAKYFAGETNW